ncbi:hypothetical protein PKOR_15020 [Pontibacter korlensis]|uniref:Uncharacterized protein n=1 Tax=Pontibacter korlensis TaxID=400092 RepID=A0A0E3ZF60_9BACT|nr:hypothetical protein [Pontibacter korlensis]AKD04159.1 hypothetical protein PKOR_15020 [Pontibacter korlensis]
MQLLKYAFQTADEVGLVLLLIGSKLPSEIEALTKDAAIVNRRTKRHTAGYNLRLKLTDKVKTFILSVNYLGWRYYGLRDIAFYRNGIELLAIISPDNQAMIRCTAEQREELSKLGFDFHVSWDADSEDEKTGNFLETLLDKIIEMLKGKK